MDQPIKFNFNNKRLILLGIAVICCAVKLCFAKENNITFSDACITGNSVTIAAVGDVLLHSPLQNKASKYGFESLWLDAIPHIQNVDIAYANIEGPIARGMKRKGDDNIYSSFPYFNYSPALAFALKKSGFSIVSTANNHALDRFSAGIDKTIEALDEANLYHVGTRMRGSSKPWFYILNKNNLKIAWIACTEMTNGNPDLYHQVLHCYKKNDRRDIINTIMSLKNKVDAIIILPHWGEEYHVMPNSEQTRFAHEVLDAGATAVIGSHPHVLQPLKKYITKDGRATLIAYSLGNFVSYQGNPLQRTTVIMLFGLTKKSAGNTIINGVRLVPMYMKNRSGSANIRLMKFNKDNSALPFYNIISRVMPIANLLYSSTIITNPQCHK